MKFSTKVFIYIFLSTAVIISGMAGFTYSWTKSHKLKDNIQYQRELATLIALKSEDYILTNDRVALYNFYTSIIQVDPFMDYIFVEQQDGILVHTFEKGVPRGLLQLNSVADPSVIDITPVKNNEGEIIFHLRVGVGDPAYATLHYGISVTKIYAELGEYRKLTMIVGGLLLAVFPFGIAVFLSRLISRPLKTLRDGVGRIGHGELGFRMDMPPGEEMRQLAGDINAMAENLEKLRDGLQGEISERRQAQHALQNQTDLLNNVIDNIPHNVFWKDRNSKYLGCNRVFTETAGLEAPGDVVGKSDRDLPWRPSETEFFIQCDREVMASGLPMQDVEETLARADGQERSVITSKVPLKDSEGAVYGVLGIFYDITERKLMEETLKQSQKMEAIGTLAGGIAHDFNNILGSIYGYTELAMDAATQGSDAYESLEQVLKSAQRAKELIRQILTFSRKGQEERKPLFLAGIVKEEAKLLRSTLPTTVEIRQQIDPEAGMVNADLTQMHQVVMNLCTNAAYAMREKGGVLTIALVAEEITSESSKRYHDLSPGPFVKLKVSDTGTGIDPNIVHRIFEPFFTTKPKERGTGMGLAVVHGIIRDHGGDIVVESQPGEGTTFTVLLPQVVSGARIEAERSAIVPTGVERILFVDDEKSLLEMMDKMLISLGYEVTAMGSSLEALEAYRSNPEFFDIVITDHTMPHMTGYRLSQCILEANPDARIILCTGYSDSITPEKVADAGIKKLLYKPLEKMEIAKAIRKVLDT
jgi:PAS domain S-box-containing protein